MSQTALRAILSPVSGLHALDLRIFYALYAFPSGPLEALMVTLTIIGSGWTSFAVVPFLAKRSTRRVSTALAICCGITALFVFTLKTIIARARPFTALPDVRALVFSAPTDHSCPSGHAAGAFSVATFLVVWLFRSRGFTTKTIAISLVLYVLAFGICASRVYLGVHFPSDVTLGAILGTITGSTAAMIFTRKNSPSRESATT